MILFRNHESQTSMGPTGYQDEENTYNILVIGPSQSGKSTMIAAIGQYLSLGTEIDFRYIGDGNLSCTKDVRVVEHVSHIPGLVLVNTDTTSLLSDKLDNLSFGDQEKPKESRVDISKILGERDYRKYKKRLNDDDNIEVRQLPPTSKKRYRFRIFDTPGLEDTDGEDVKNVANILEAVSKAGEIHLVLVTVSFGSHLSPGLQTALKDYRNIFSDMRGLIAFVHTNLDYTSMHAENTMFSKKLATRKRVLDEIMGREVPYFVINSDLFEDRPVCLYLRQDTIRNMLSLARLNIPVPAKHMQLVKTKQMQTVDGHAISHCQLNLKELERKASELQSMQGANQAKSDANRAREIDCNNFNATKYRCDIRDTEAKLEHLDTDDLEFLDEKESHQGWNFWESFWRPSIELRVSRSDCQIDVIREEMSGFDREFAEGGEGCNFWATRIKRGFWVSGHYRVKFYARRRTRHQHAINQLKHDLHTQKEALQSLVDRIAVLEASGPIEEEAETKEQRLQIQADQFKFLETISRLERKALHLNFFKAVAEAGVYEGSQEECSKKVADFYAGYIPAEGE
ncbi:hypothetical protein BGW38_010961 [Lunasporangiospora selenospora]|uniref:Uncharacterized protein n=1 Tax=Lunasporangiospora selenospora TaxID=979761 RepID=A0A9P6FXQ6_9FUNG|nr:hypothetical protein BGW38_010961 [Lunasporangiospora selenospora]